MLQFQELMGRFLDTQTQVMMAYLQKPAVRPQGQQAIEAPATLLQPAPQPTRSRELSPQSLAPVRTERPAIQAPPQEPPQEPYSGAQTSQNGFATAERANGLSSAEARPVPKKAETDKQHITSKLLEIVSDRTGYPADMLDLNSDLEADLGIDSIKRIEILGGLRDALCHNERSDVNFVVDDLTKIKTLGKIVDSVYETLNRASSPVGAAVAAEVDSKKN
jgi:acyl carrier protein